MATTDQRIAAAGLMAAALALAACREPPPSSYAFTANGLEAQVTVAAREAAELPLAVDAARSTLQRILRSLDPHDPKSDIARINAIAATTRWPLPQDTFRVLDLALHYGRETDGAFDITTAPLARLYGIGDPTPPSALPADEILTAARLGCGPDKIHLSDDGAVAFYSPLTRIDLGPMAPGYALDLSVVNIRRRGVTNVLVRFGTSLRCLGQIKPGEAWTERLPDPRDPQRAIGTFSFRRNAALCVASLYDEGVTLGGERLGGIIDPRTGRPAKGTLTAAVTGPTATLGAALAQALIILGPEAATNILGRFPKYEALIVPDRDPPELWMTEGFGSWFQPDPAVAAARHKLTRTPDVRAQPPQDKSDQKPEAEPAAP